MSIPPESPWRGCAAFLKQPVSATDILAAQNLTETVYYYNCHVPKPPLADVEYRGSSSNEEDVVRHVFRWDTTPYQKVFKDGFTPRRQQDTKDEVYFSVDDYVHKGGRPLDSTRVTNYAYVSTTLSSSWYPSLKSGQQMQSYRYEIYAPGGVWVAETLDDRYKYPGQDEVCFVAGIAPQYIRSAQLFKLSATQSRYTKRERVDTILYINDNFNPQSHPPRYIKIQRPIKNYQDKDGKTKLLEERHIQPSLTMQLEKLRVSEGKDVIDYYTNRVAEIDSYIDGAFSSPRQNEVYMFMKNEYVLINYTPGSTTNDKVLNGPVPTCDGFPSLRATAFTEHGIDCAFRYKDKSEAFMFSGNLCIRISFTPGTTNDKILEGPMIIDKMFPFFKGTVFEKGVDAAFESVVTGEAYLFKGNRYALIRYGPDRKLIATRTISEGFPCLKNTIFATDIGAAFASHRAKEVYLFKDDSYALLYFTPGSTDDKLIGGVKKILPNWSSLSGILPRKNYGLDFHDHSTPDPERDQDEI